MLCLFVLVIYAKDDTLFMQIFAQYFKSMFNKSSCFPVWYTSLSAFKYIGAWNCTTENSCLEMLLM